MRTIVVGVGGFASDVGKTELMCALLRRLPGWEAIKTTRGHFRSCGKHPEACCVSHLLGPEPIVRSGRSENYALGKDTARYWDAGARNVHWVIGTDTQIGTGVQRALDQVQSDGVLIEGNSFRKSVETDFFIMVVRPDRLKPKSSARQVLRDTSALYLSRHTDDVEQIKERCRIANGGLDWTLPKTIYSSEDLPALAELLCSFTPKYWRPKSA
jgi:hypothetical protein